MGLVAEIGVGIKNFVADVFIRRPTDGVSAGLGAELDCATGQPAIFRREIVGQHPEFFE